MRQFDQRSIVQIDHAELHRRVRPVECTRLAVARIVHDDVDRETGLLDFFRKSLAAADGSQVRGDRCRCNRVGIRQPIGDFAQGALCARGKDDVVTVMSKTLREVHADPGRCARHEGRLSVTFSRARHGILPWRESRPPRRVSVLLHRSRRRTHVGHRIDIDRLSERRCR